MVVKPQLCYMHEIEMKVTELVCVDPLIVSAYQFILGLPVFSVLVVGRGKNHWISLSWCSGTGNGWD